MIRQCIVCGAAFKCSPSDKTITCSPECRSLRRKSVLTGRKRSDAERAAISRGASGRDMSEIQRMGTDAAKKSAKAGRFHTNSSAKQWGILSPDGVLFKITNLRDFIRKNAENFDIDSENDADVDRIHNGFRVAKNNSKNGRNCVTYMGWSIVWWDDRKNCERDVIEDDEAT